MQAMQNLAHSLDSTRLCTAAMSGGWGQRLQVVLDVTGFNYSLGQQDSYHSTPLHLEHHRHGNVQSDHGSRHVYQ
jgi:hypothetical protein